MYRSNTGLTGFICASVLMSVSTAALAWKAGGNVGIDTRYTDNASLVSINERDDLITTGRATATLSEDAGPLTGNATAGLQYLDYMDNTFGGQTYFTLGSAARWEQLSNRLVWSVSDFFSQTSIDNLAANTPDNTQDTNAFNLSAAVNMPVADRHTITVSPSFSDFYYDNSGGNDNQQLGLAAGWAYQLDPTISFSLNGRFSDVDFEDDTSGADNESTNLNIAVAVTRARSRYSVNVGATKVERDSGAETDGVTGRISWQYDFTDRSNIIANVSSDITDASNIFLSSSIDPNTGSFTNVQVSNDVIRNSVFRVTYSRKGSTVNSSIWTELRELDYETTMVEREVQEVGANVSYRFTPLVTGSVSGRFTRTEDTINEYKNTFLDGSLNYSLSRKLTANVGLRLQSYDSTDAAAEYDALSILAGIGYRIGR